MLKLSIKNKKPDTGEQLRTMADWKSEGRVYSSVHDSQEIAWNDLQWDNSLDDFVYNFNQFAESLGYSDDTKV